MRKVLLVFLALAVPMLVARAQDLSNLAKQAREQRMKVMRDRSVRIYNNDNMPKRPANEGPTAAGAMSPATTPPAGAPEIGESLPPDQPPPSDAPDLDAMGGQIKQSRAGMKGLEERLSLAEDELNLLQVQQASELAPDTQATLSGQIKDKGAAVAGLRQEIEKAKKDIEKAEKEFKAQGGKLEEKK